MNRVIRYGLTGLIFCIGCTQQPSKSKGTLQFTLVDDAHSNIDFNNKLEENDSTNFLVNQYIYIGSGVGVGDFNRDGLQDLFFAGAQADSKLYINKGDFEFEDVTDNSGILKNKWSTGVSVVDINNDSLPDIYVCVTNVSNPEQRRNLLYINKGNLQFKEEAKAYGLDDPGFSTQAAFLDYDKDGDLDMYLMNHNVFHDEPNNFIQDTKGNRAATDKFFRNEGIPPGMDHPVFKDVSEEVGIGDVGYGLGIVVSDLNKDGWPDIYIANDFISNDILWLNNKKGGFTNAISRSIRHQSYNSMGVDAADLNNDQWPELAVLDMQPEINARKKIMFSGANPDRYEMEQKMGGFQPQYARNMLQLHNGNRIIDSSTVPFFSEIGNFTGIAETDWSWSVLMADFDNDGKKDIHITNGLAKDLTNNDFLSFRHGKDMAGTTGTGTNSRNDSLNLRKELDSYGSVKISNYFFHNEGNLAFTNTTQENGLELPSISHGAAEVDLDNDGDLDLVVNNMNQKAFIWKNEIRHSAKDSTHNYLTIQLEGDRNNLNGFGAKITIYTGDKMQFLEQNPVRGYLSTVDSRLHFGIDSLLKIDSLKITWPDNKVQTIAGINANQVLHLKHSEAVDPGTDNSIIIPQFLESAIGVANPGFRHNENSYFDFGKQRLIPQKFSQLGPPLAVADVNNDGLDDYFVGGGAYQWGMLYIQHPDGKFYGKNLSTGEKLGEDVVATFFDADNDNDADLLICAGSSEYGNSSTLNIPRLFINDGKGNFTYQPAAIPEGVTTLSQSIAIADFDGDKDADIFIGGRVLPDQYPFSPNSYILQNDHGRFTDVTAKVCPALVKPGLINAAEWTDFNNDGVPDLVICGDWMPVRFFANNRGTLEEVTAKTGLNNMNGMWRSLKAVDLDSDGDMDFVVGNLGLNNKYHPSPERPMQLFANDFDKNGSIDLIPAYYIKNNEGHYELFPAIDRSQFAEELIFIKKKYLLNETYAKAPMKEILGILDQNGMVTLSCQSAASVWLENKGNGVFTAHELPLEAQVGPVNAISVLDFGNEGKAIFLAGNEYQAEVSAGRYDASYGLVLKADKSGKLTVVGPSQSGFVIDGTAKHIKVLNNNKTPEWVLVAVNNDSLKCFRINQKFWH